MTTTVLPALTALLLLTSLPAHPKLMMAEPTPPTDAVFAFSNEAGSHLLALGEVTAPERITTAVCPGGARHKVTFEKMQPEGADDSGRAIAANFDATAGALYRIDGAPIPLGEDDFVGVTCLLLTDRFLEDATLTALTPAKKKKRPCNAADRKRIGADRSRRVTRCTVLGALGGKRLMLATFAPEGKKLLAALVVPVGDGFSFHDFEGTRDPGSTSCWRVDDGCRFPVDSLRILAGISSAAGLHLAILWGAFEGENETLVLMKGDRSKEVVTGYRYWAPL